MHGRKSLERSRKFSRAVLVLAICLAWKSAQAQGSGTTQPADRTVNHQEASKSGNRTLMFAPLWARDGRAIVIEIRNTCPEHFTYDVEKVAAAPPPGAPDIQKTTPCTPTTQLVTVVHRREFGGYIVHVRPKATGGVAVGGVELKPMDLVVPVETGGWDHESAGGFTLSKLTDSRFGLIERTVDGEQKTFVVRDREAEDAWNPGMAAFVHIFHNRWPHLGPSFGIGISEATQPTYYAGGTWRLGSRGALTVGRAWGELDRLPAGTTFDQPVDPGILGNLQKRIDDEWFFGFSFSFINPGDRLQKPFAGQTPAVTAGTSK